MGSLTNGVRRKFLMDVYVEKICDVFRPYSSFGFIKEEDRDKVTEIVDEIKRQENLLVRESAYNDGFLTGVKSAQRMGSIN